MIDFSICFYSKICRKYPIFPPYVEVSWDFEFMGTRNNFPTSFCVFSHPLLHSFSPLIIFNLLSSSLSYYFLQSSVFFFSFSPSFPAVILLHCSDSARPKTLWKDLNFCCIENLSPAQLDPSSYHYLTYILPSQLNCHPHLHHRVQARYLPSISCFRAIGLSLLSIWINFILSQSTENGLIFSNQNANLIWHICDPLYPRKNTSLFFSALLGCIKTSAQCRTNRN